MTLVTKLISLVGNNKVSERAMEEIGMDGESNSDKAKTESRRKFLKTAGKFAVYTPPALMLMSKPGSEVFAQTGGGDVGGDPQNASSCGDGGLGKGAMYDLLRTLGMC